MPYDLHDVDVPRVSGTSLKLAASLLEKSSAAWVLEKKILKDMGFENFTQEATQESPTFFPRHPYSQKEIPNPNLEELAEQSTPPAHHPFHPPAWCILLWYPL